MFGMKINKNKTEVRKVRDVTEELNIHIENIKIDQEREFLNIFIGNSEPQKDVQIKLPKLENPN